MFFDPQPQFYFPTSNESTLEERVNKALKKNSDDFGTLFDLFKSCDNKDTEHFREQLFRNLIKCDLNTNELIKIFQNCVSFCFSGNYCPIRSGNYCIYVDQALICAEELKEKFPGYFNGEFSRLLNKKYSNWWKIDMVYLMNREK